MIKWVLIALVIYLILRHKGSKDTPYQNPALMRATSAKVTVRLANGLKTSQVFGLEDVRSSGKMPGTNLPCYIFMLDTDYLQRWAQEQHRSSLSGFDSDTLQLKSPSGDLDMAQFTWTIVYDAGRGVGDVFIRAR